MPSPALKLRCSSARNECEEEEGIRHHRRGLSLESMPQDRDEDLALFQDMRTRERDNFLHPSTADIDESLCIKLGNLENFRLGISTSARGESRDLLNTNVDKNDYDWLLTPPDTPLFPSLDQETPFVSLRQKGTLHSRLRVTPRQSRAESRSRTTHCSTSPQRPSSTCTGSHSRGRSSPTASANGSPKLRSLTPSGRASGHMPRLSASSAKPSNPTIRRPSTASSGHSSSVERGGPLQRKTRSRSSSPKIHSCHSNIPGFSSVPPPNLRTSLSDRPISHVRGSSPVSRNGEGTGNRSRRHSVSPTISRSVTSSNRHDGDHFNSDSRGSMVRSCEDEMDSIQSTQSVKKRTYTGNQVDGQGTRKQETNQNTRVQSISKRQARDLSATDVNYGSKPAMQQMHFRQNTKSMFRPLLSSAPAASFYTPKVATLKCRTNWINSSVTTSSTASSELGSCVAPDIEGSDQDVEDLGNEQKKSFIDHRPEDIIVFDDMDVKHEDVGFCRLPPKDSDCLEPQKIAVIGDLQIDSHADCHGHKICEPIIREPDKWNYGEVLLDGNLSVKNKDNFTGDAGCYHGEIADIGYTLHSNHGLDTHEGMAIYLDSQGNEVLYSNDGSTHGYFVNIQEDVPLNNRNIETVCTGTLENLQLDLLRSLEIENMQKHDRRSTKAVIMHAMAQRESKESGSAQLNSSVNCQSICLPDCIFVHSAVGTGQQLSPQNLITTNQMNSLSEWKGDEGFVRSHSRDSIHHHAASADLPSQDQASGISSEYKAEYSVGCVPAIELLGRVNNGKQAALLVEAGNAISLLGGDSQLRQCRKELNVVKNDKNASASDAGSIKQIETGDLCQTSSSKLDLESNSRESNINIPSGELIPAAGGQSDMHEASAYSENARINGRIDHCIDSFEVTNGVKSEKSEKTAGAFDVLSDAFQGEDLDSLLGNGSIHVAREFIPLLQKNSLFTEMDTKTKDVLAVEMGNKEGNGLCKEFSMLAKQKERYACVETRELSEKSMYSYYEQAGNNAAREEKQVAVRFPEQERKCISNSDILVEKTDFSIEATSYLVDSHKDTTARKRKIGFQVGVAAATADQNALEIDKSSFDSAASEGYNYNQSTNIELKCPSDYDSTDQVHVSQADSGNKINGPREYLSRSLTLAEATDTVLLCSSIVHDLAYEAAAIALEKENLLPVSSPGSTRTISEVSAPQHKNLSSGAAARWRTLSFPRKMLPRKTRDQVQIPCNKIDANAGERERGMYAGTVPQRDHIVKSRKTNSKCHCTVM